MDHDNPRFFQHRPETLGQGRRYANRSRARPERPRSPARQLPGRPRADPYSCGHRLQVSRHGATAPRAAVAAALQHLALGLDYANFKTVVAKNQGNKRAGVYSKVWSTLNTLEDN